MFFPASGNQRQPGLQVEGNSAPPSRAHEWIVQVAAAQLEAAAGFRDVAAMVERQQAAAEAAAAGMRQDVRNLHLELVRQFHVQQVGPQPEMRSNALEEGRLRSVRHSQ